MFKALLRDMAVLTPCTACHILIKGQVEILVMTGRSSSSITVGIFIGLWAVGTL